jgi:hypothetical protein
MRSTQLRAIIHNAQTGWTAYLGSNNLLIKRGASNHLEIPVSQIDYLISVLEDAQMRSERTLQAVK